MPLEDLEAAAGRYLGNFLEGLELTNFHEFHAWVVAEQELTSRAQAMLLRALVARLAGTPERALPYARSLVGILPYDEDARAGLIRLLVLLGRAAEAEQQYRLGARLLEEMGAQTSGALFAAWRGPPGGRTPAMERAPTPSAQREPAGLVGRDAEVERLATAYAEVAARQEARVLLVCGDPGIGKSRLLETAAARARDADAMVLTASAFESNAIRPFALWLDALRNHESGAAAEVLGAADLDNRERLFDSLSDFVARQSAERPLVLIFDDLQWSDESSVAALHYAARMNRSRPLLAVLATRDEELRDNAGVQQVLRGLRHDDLLDEMRLAPLSEAVLRRLIDIHAPGADSETISRECGGNPLLALELARAEAAGEDGGSLDELVRERLSRFDVDAAELLRWAAVLAPHLELDLLTRVTGMDAVRVGAVLELGEVQGMLRPSDRGFRFSHDLITRCIYADISPTRRRVMHRRVAEILEQDAALDLAFAADLAHHASQSGDPGLAARAMVLAGRLCLRFFANDDAQALARRGLRFAAKLSDGERVRLSVELHDILLSAAPLEDWKAAAEEYVALAEQALDHGALAHARLGYHMASYVRWEHGHWADAREESLQAERVVRGGSEAEHIIGMAEAARCLAMIERDLTQADAMLMEAQALALRQRLRHPAIPLAMGMLRLHEGLLDEAEDLFKEARTECKAVGDRLGEFQANEHLVMIDFERGRFESAQQRCAGLVEIGDKLREGSEAPFARALAALCRYALGDEAGPELKTAVDELRLVDAKHRLAYTLTRAAALDLERGCLDSALERASEALEHAEALERATEMLLANMVLAQARQAAGDHDACNLHLEAMGSLGRDPVARWALERARPWLEKLA
jgi:hypothetical protein